MTRAEDELYVTGALTPAQKRETQLAGTWYDAIKTSLLSGSSVTKDEAGEDEAIVFPLVQQPPAPVPPTAATVAAADGPLVLPPLPAQRAPCAAVDGAVADRRDRARPPRMTTRKGAEGGIAPCAAQPTRSNAASGTRWRGTAALLPDRRPTWRSPGRPISPARRPGDLRARQPRVPFRVHARCAGRPVTLGRIDRLVATLHKVLIVDFKSDANPPHAAGFRAPYVTQLSSMRW